MDGGGGGEVAGGDVDVVVGRRLDLDAHGAEERTEPVEARLRGAAALGFPILAVVFLVGSLACSTIPDPREQAKKREWGHHCPSAWDGNHDRFETQIRDLLNDPGSMETHSTQTSRLLDTGLHRISMDYSATNAFGGRVRTSATGFLDPDTCEVMVVDFGFN